MATERLSMRKTKEILRQKWLLTRTHRAAAASVGVSLGAVHGALTRAEAAGLDWPAVDAMTEEALEAALYKANEDGGGALAARAMPDCAYLHAERKKAGVTLQLLHVEYLEQHPDGYRYSQFCEHYRAWLAKRKLTMRQEHLAGDKLFVDYSGKRARLVDPTSGEVTEVELFVAVLGASNYTYAEATRTQQGPDWIASHVRALTFFGGVPAAIVPDQLKSGVTTACRYEPGIQRTYEELATHYGTTVLPARPLHPRDKAKVEVAVQIAQRWILARLRHQTFFSLDALNDRIAELVTDLNDRVMRVYGVSRRALFDRTDGPALRTLPATRFVYGTWKKARVNIDYHVEIEHHYYSAPHALAREEVYARITDATVEIHHRGEQVAVHVRSASRGRHTTVPGHMPALHQKHLEWTPSRIIHWAGTIGPSTAALVEAILNERRHPEHGYRSCLGILRLGKTHGDDRLEAACARAVRVGARSFRHVAAILKAGLDRVAIVDEPTPSPSPATDHENVRGRGYYH
jgi:transposase